MRAQIIGRVLGTGLRVAGKMAGERLSAAAEPAAAQPAPPSPRPQPNRTNRKTQESPRAAGQAQSSGGAGVARGVGGFLRPFRRVGGIIWLEVTGVFFLLPVIVFAPNLWRMRASWAHGPITGCF
jgi:hypothetical protein